MISAHCPLHYNGYLQPQQQQQQQQQQQVPPPQQQQSPQPQGVALNHAPPHLFTQQQHPQMRLQPMQQMAGGGGVGGVGVAADMSQTQRINQQQQSQSQSQSQPHHHHHHSQQQNQPHHHQHHHSHHGQSGEQQQQQQQQQPQHRMNHQMYAGGNSGPAAASQSKGLTTTNNISSSSSNGNKVMLNGGPTGVVKASIAMSGGGVETSTAYSHKSQFRKYAPPTTTRLDGIKPKGSATVPSPASMTMNSSSSHIPTVSANGIPGAAETTVTNLRTTTAASSAGALLSPEAHDVGMLGKEKTAMCLVNELSRFNKLTQQYRLTNETGPAHQRRFTVTLTLGKEEYTAEGGSIKKAQHAAASEAIQKTKYRHPPMKVHAVRSESVNLTPTVELNALAMKRREKAVYIFDPPPAPVPNPMAGHLVKGGVNYNGGVGGGQPGSHYGGNSGPQFAYRGLNNATTNMGPSIMNTRRFPAAGIGGGGAGLRVMGEMGRGRPMMGGGRMMRGGGMGGPMLVGAPPPPPPTEQVQVTLEVGGRQFIGYGFTAQAARHNAAAKALEVLRKLPADGQTEGGEEVAAGGEAASENGGKPDSKSPVSMIHEIALKRSLTVAFSVKNETGPSHMKVFYTVCTVGELSVEGEGNSKKASKKHAAEKMYQELLKLPPINVSPQPTTTGAAAAHHLKGAAARLKKKAPETVKKKAKQQIIKPEAEPVEELNPISRLMQIQQAKKGKEPVYLLVDQRGTARRREFEMSVEVDGVTMTGTGPNKKLAKRIAAERLLVALGFEVTSSGSDNKEEGGGGESSGSPVKSKLEKVKKERMSTESAESPPVVSANGESVQLEGRKAASSKGGVRKEKVAEKVEEEVESKNESGSDGARPKDQLIYLSKIIGFKVQFSDFPKGNHGEYLTLITLNTEPPQLCHGSGKTLEASHDQAALTTLNLLSELGLDNVRPKKVAEVVAVTKKKTTEESVDSK